MVVDLAGAAAGRGRFPGGWLARLEAIWHDQRAEAVLPNADELFLADLADLVPNLLLACRDDETDEFRIEFAGAGVKALLPLEPVGTIPEHEPPGHPLSWLGTAFLRTRHPAVPRPQWLSHESWRGLFLPYGAFDGRVTLILAAVDRAPRVDSIAEGAGHVVRLRRVPRPASE